MIERIERNRRRLRALYEARGPRYALIFEPLCSPRGGDLGDFTLSRKPVRLWLPWYVKYYEESLRASAALDDDGVPFVNLNTNTGVFAAAFGCPLHAYQESGANACARPIVTSPAAADRLALPTLAAPTLQRVLELGQLLQRELGPDVPISVPDLQSPFDIANLVWNKADLLLAMLDAPDAVKALIEKAHQLLTAFLREFARLFPQGNFCHCPHMWVPPEYGCHVSEDEIGIISPEMFDEFVLPSLQRLSAEFGGLWLHCCADADHQYPGFARIPNLRGLNRKFIRGPRRCIEMFSATALFSMGWTPEAELLDLLDIALPATRFLFNLSGFRSVEEARPVYDRLRARMPR